MPKTIVIVGGVAGGASAAARARRLSEEANIIMLERGPYVSFANCGLPYHIGGVIKEWDALQVQTPESLKARFNLDVRVLHEATRIDRQNKRLQVRDLKNQRDYSLDYDYLILSPGAEAFKPPIPGIDSPNVFTLKTIPDMDRIIDWMNQHPVKHATVVGAGFIGIETAENFRHRGLAVTLIEREKQVMPPMDPEMTALLHQHLRFNGVDLRLGSTVTGISATGQRLGIQFDSGTPLETDLVVLSIGVRPESKLAKEAGLALNERGAIKVNEVMETSDPAILAVGDAIEVSDFVTETQVMMPLAGPANRQGRIAASKIFGEDIPYRGTTGTWVVKVFDLTAAQTGPSEKTLKRLGKPYAKVYLHPSSHAGYYPGAAPMAFKLLYDPQNGRVLGAQIVGTDGVDKRTDVIATAVAAKMTVSDLHHLELCYAPPYGSAKDPVNLAGMIADNLMKGSHQGLTPDQLQDLKPNSYVLIDVRTALEHEAGHIPGSQHIPVDELRNRLGELPKDKEIILYCQVGLRGYVANRMLTQKGIKNRNLVGGYKTWAMFHEERLSSSIPAQI
ncbi:MAG TPA: FAD-dependent oxidoreductase, partial [Candidatus Ozemobacteraceae bacterium]|nr:FAD-dependent oxidoreductase [Candidatus Ozemobacteraceae bacterium]